jgi:hypothetical protein
MNRISCIFAAVCAGVGLSGCTSPWMIVRRPDAAQEVSWQEFAEASAAAERADAAKRAAAETEDTRRPDTAETSTQKSIDPAAFEALFRMIEQVKQRNNIDVASLASDENSDRRVGETEAPSASAGPAYDPSRGGPANRLPAPADYHPFAADQRSAVDGSLDVALLSQSRLTDLPLTTTAPNQLRTPVANDADPRQEAQAASPPANAVAPPQVEVQTAAYQEPAVAPEDPNAAEREYQSLLDELVRVAEAELKNPDLSDDDRARREIVLRMLRLASERPKDWSAASAQFSNLEQSEAEFWRHLMFAVNVMLDARQTPDIKHRGTYAMAEVHDALNWLANLSALQVKNLAFCTNVQSYGVYTKFEEYRFRPGQEVILYAEVDNFAAEPKHDQFETALDGMCELYDAGKNRVGVHKFGVDRELCNNRRRDYYLPYRYFLPDDLYPGQYSLKLTITDVKSNKLDQASIDFTVERR